MDDDDRAFERECFYRVAFHLSFGKTGDYRRALISRLEGVENTNGDFLPHRGKYCFRVKDFCAEVGELSGLLKGKFRYDFGVLNEARVGGVHTGDIRPYFYHTRTERRAYNSGAVIAPSAA